MGADRQVDIVEPEQAAIIDDLQFGALLSKIAMDQPAMLARFVQSGRGGCAQTGGSKLASSSPPTFFVRQGRMIRLLPV